MGDSGISRRDFMKSVGQGAAAWSLTPQLFASDAKTSKRPNILILMTDQQRFDSLGCCSSQAVPTPNLDRLAREGAVFDHCYTNCPICTPARASLLTGKHIPGHGVSRLYDNLPESEILMTKRLQARGYQTALFGKLHVSGTHHEADHRHPNDGFDIYEWCLEGPLRMDSPYHGYRKWLEKKDPAFCERLRREGRQVKHIPRELHMTHWAAERTIDFLSRQDGQQPFFCMMSIFDPHDPYDGYPMEMEKLVNKNEIPELIIVPNGLEGKPEALMREHKYGYLGDYDKFSREDIRKMRLAYFASIALADLEFGRVIKTLEEKGLAENTLVIFTSDHGDMLGDHQLFVKGAYFYDPSVRVPLVMRWPARFGGGRRVEGLVQLHDLAATTLAAAGVNSDERRKFMPEAADLTPLAAGESPRARDFAVCAYRNSGIRQGGIYWDPPIHGTMFRDERYKINLFHDPSGAAGEPQGELYSMQADPQERRNLWREPAADGEWDERPAHRVTISRSFRMSATEVTNAQYEQFDPSHESVRGKSGLSKEDDEAVIFVSWRDAVAFCGWLSNKEGKPYRLPTEAEWEYACRAGTTTAYATGDTLSQAYYPNQSKDDHEDWGAAPVPTHVGQTPPNAWGLLDMHGNVEEWCYDGYGPYDAAPKTDPIGYVNEDIKVTRGGSHSTLVSYLRSANRSGAIPTDRHWLLGFRIVQASLPATVPLRRPGKPTWQDGVSQKKYGWKEHSLEPYFEGPIPYVHIAENSNGPLYSTHNHCPAVTWCDNGDLLAAWFSTNREAGREMAIAASRLKAGAHEWTRADVFFKVPDRNMTGTALLKEPNRLQKSVGALRLPRIYSVYPVDRLEAR